MSEQDFVLSSGSKLHVSSAPFNDANALRKALIRTAKGLTLADDPLKTDFNELKNMLIEAASSDEVETCLFKCMERASYENLKADRKLFDDPSFGEKARTDLLEIYWKVIEVNCLPFFAKAVSVFSAQFKNAAATLKSTPGTTTP